MFRRLRLIALAVLVAVSVAACSGGSLTEEDVDATLERLSERMSAGQGMEETYLSLQGSVITSDFAVEGGEELPASTEALGKMVQLQVLPSLLEYARQDPTASVKIKGDTLVMRGKTSGVSVEFEKSGEIFLIRRIVLD